MITDDFDVVCIAVDEAETDAPLVVDRNGMLPLPIANQGIMD